MAYEIGPRDALVIVDPQNDFCPGGALAVEGGDEIMAPITALARRFRDAGGLIVVTQDWHPADHKSFASTHEGKAPFGTAEMPYGEQVLWPDHCVQASPGADFHPDLQGALKQAHLRRSQGLQSRGRFLFGLLRERQGDDDRPRRLAEGQGRPPLLLRRPRL